MIPWTAPQRDQNLYYFQALAQNAREYEIRLERRRERMLQNDFTEEEVEAAITRGRADAEALMKSPSLS